MSDQKPAVAFGGAVAAIGLVGVIWQYGVTRSTNSGHVPRQLFLILIPVALVAWIIMREKKPGRMGDAAAALWATTRTALLFLLLLLPACSLFASGGLTKSSAYLTLLKSDLRNLAFAQKAYFDSAGSYTANLERLDLFKPSVGASVPEISASSRSWSATNTHEMLGQTRCGIAVNTANPVVPDAAAGNAACASAALSLDVPVALFYALLIPTGLAIGAMFGASRPADPGVEEGGNGEPAG